nr:hypothetical protein GCM10025732_44630 [Glycomyces mayteni]
MPVPDVHFADASLELCDAPYFFMPYIDAENIGIVQDSLSPEALADYWEQLGALNSRLNGIKGAGFGPSWTPASARGGRRSGAWPRTSSPTASAAAWTSASGTTRSGRSLRPTPTASTR